MKTKRVRIIGLDNNAANVQLGEIALKNGRLTGDTNIAKNIIQIGLADTSKDAISPRADPEGFLGTLHRIYKSAYCTALKVEEVG